MTVTQIARTVSRRKLGTNTAVKVTAMRFDCCVGVTNSAQSFDSYRVKVERGQLHHNRNSFLTATVCSHDYDRVFA